MGLIKSLFGGSPSPKPDRNQYIVRVKCSRCGETIEGRVDLDNDLSLNETENGYLSRKTLMGGNRCFQQIEVKLSFDSTRQITGKDITGGEFLE